MPATSKRDGRKPSKIPLTARLPSRYRKTIKKRDHITLNRKTDLTIDELLSDDLLPVLKKIYPHIPDNTLNEFSKGHHEGPHLRAINGDFIAILRSDEKNIGSKISKD